MAQPDGSSPLWLQILSVALPAAVALLLAVLSIHIHRFTSSIEQRNWMNQKLVEKQLAVYECMAPLINDVYCYFDCVGNWKELTPPKIIEAKRTLDKTFFVNEFLFSRDFGNCYSDFINACFKAYNCPGHDAQLRTAIVTPDGDRSLVTPQWQPEWKRYFCGEELPDTCKEPQQPCQVSERCLVACAYQDLMLGFAQEVGIVGELNDPPKGESRWLRSGATAGERQQTCDECWNRSKIKRLAHQHVWHAGA